MCRLGCVGVAERDGRPLQEFHCRRGPVAAEQGVSHFAIAADHRQGVTFRSVIMGTGEGRNRSLHVAGYEPQVANLLPQLGGQLGTERFTASDPFVQLLCHRGGGAHSRFQSSGDTG